MSAGGTKRVHRFSRTERTLHWANAVGFFVLLASGLVLYLPSLAVAVGRRPLVKDDPPLVGDRAGSPCSR